ncbi:MAG: hypothetical protein ACK4JE_03010, partial [Endomicrobiia bacterium]
MKYKLTILILLSWYSFFLIQKINLTTADLGRHIKNGEMVLSGNFDVLRTNFYSYTNSTFPINNHHWLSGVIFFLIYKFFGFSGAHLFFIILSLLTFCIFFYVSERESGSATAGILSFLIIPLIAKRTEVRPEVFSYLFAGV